MDYYSNFTEVGQQRETTSRQVIERCKSHFARHGIPDVFVTDNGPQFSSGKFSKFSSDYQFQHHTSSPHYPRSNGKVEKAVQTVKNLLRKAQVENRDFHLALLDLRNSPTNDDIGSPVQRLIGCRTKTLLPTTDNLLRPKIVSPTTVKSHRLEQQERQKHAYDKTARPLTTLQPGDHVRFKNRTLWQPAVVTEVSAHPRSYIIQPLRVKFIATTGHTSDQTPNPESTVTMMTTFMKTEKEKEKAVHKAKRLGLVSLTLLTWAMALLN